MKIKSAFIAATVIFGLMQLTQAQCPQICDSNDNTALGTSALEFNTNGQNNTAVGFEALQNNVNNNNTATGFQALKTLSGGRSNTAFGAGALTSLRQGFANTAVGQAALTDATNTSNNTALGYSTLAACTTGLGNTAVGYLTMGFTSAGRNNTAIGQLALPSNQTGSDNIAIGYQTLLGITTTSGNIAIGNTAGLNLNGSNNIDIASPGVRNESNTIRIGTAETHQATYIAGISGVTVAGGVGVVVDSSGHLGTTTSSARFKEAIEPMDKASEAILALKPVSFRYKHELDREGIPQFGLVAEDVQKVNPDLVARDEDGKPYTVRYDAVNAMLLNEFLKEHRKVTKLKSTVAEQRKQIAALTAGLQKVSAQLELNRRAQETVSNNH